MRQLKITKQVTNRESKSLDKYLQDISKLPMVTAEEEVELAKKIREGCQESLDKLTTANLRFVVSVAKQYQNQGLKLPDLINEGNAGLVKAAKRFDETRGFKFISYAVWWIRQAILSALAEQSRIKSNDIRRGKISDEQFDKFIETSKNISELPLYIDETPAISIAALSNRARRIKRLHGLDMLVVDYIQLVRATNTKDGRVQEISEITQGLKAIAKELAIPVLALSQLSRQVEQRDNHKPQLSDLRDSGSIEQDADVVMFVYREGYYLEKKEPRPATVEHAEWQAKMNEVSNLAEIIIGKHRHGPTGNVMLEFEAMFTKFKDIQNS